MSGAMTGQARFTIQPGGTLQGVLRVPGDKSISHRAVILGSLAEGETRIDGFLEAGDTLNTLNAFRQMGVPIHHSGGGRVEIGGVGLHGLSAPSGALDLGNSGTGMRLLSGVLAAQRFDSQVVGDDSLSRRPMGRVIKPLTEMGALIRSEDGCPPLSIQGGQTLHGIHYAMPVASAQVKSALLLAGLYADGETCVTEPAAARDHTERMLRGFGYAVDISGSDICLKGGGRLQGCHVDVPADISSAAFFLVGAAITPGSDLTLKHVGVNPTRVGVLNILGLMGAEIALSNETTVGGEPVADLRVRGGTLRGIQIPRAEVPLAIDEFPALFIAAACAEGETILSGAEELRVKESDRIAAMATGLTALGIANEVFPDGIRIQGGALTGGAVESFGDHRIAMSFAMAGLRADGPIEVKGCDNVATSFPEFVEMALSSGLAIRVRHD
ncbi:MAG: 3-phosphoshikimate 1-carboxyvinyltransferase [Gammaproteobacteria bacterium]|nr:3-phosphoshikimate 1-carboxyvinyltransferase [Gammaproteobacteria bacterium]